MSNSFMDKLSAKAEELQLQRKAEDLVDAVSQMAKTAVDKAGEAAHENSSKIEGMLDKAAAKVDESTDGKYSDKIAKAREQASAGVSKLAEKGSAAAGAASDAADSAKDAAVDAKDSVKDVASGAADSAKDTVESAKDAATDAADSATEKASDVWDKATDDTK